MATSIVRPVGSRAVHLRILPRPSHISESRSMMRLIANQFGEVEYFKNLKYDRLPHPNAALVIFKDEEAALKCVKQSPIRFQLGDDGNASISRSKRTAGQVHDDEGRGFHIRVNTARAHFRDQIDASKFHGPFFIDTAHAEQQDLRARVPLPGLSDLGWSAEGKPWRVLQREKKRETTGETRRKGLQEIWREGEVAEKEGGGESRVDVG